MEGPQMALTKLTTPDDMHEGQSREGAGGIKGCHIDDISTERLHDTSIRIDGPNKSVWRHYNPSTIKQYILGPCTACQGAAEEHPEYFGHLANTSIDDHASIMPCVTELEEFISMLQQEHGTFSAPLHTAGDPIFKSPLTNEKFTINDAKRIFPIIGNRDWGDRMNGISHSGLRQRLRGGTRKRKKQQKQQKRKKRKKQKKSKKRTIRLQRRYKKKYTKRKRKPTTHKK